MFNFLKKAFSAPATFEAEFTPLPAVHTAPKSKAQDASSYGSPRQTSVPFTYYEALRRSPDRTPIPVGALGLVRSLVETYGRQQLAALGRYVYDNYGIAGYAVDTIANYSTPLLAQAASVDTTANKLYEDYFANWANRADFYGRFDFDMLQRLASKQIDTDGDIGFDMPDTAGFPQIRFHETHTIGSLKTRLRGDGIILDPMRRLVGFEVYLDNSDVPTIIDANKMRLLFDPDRISSLRGISPIRRGLNDLRDSHDIKAFEKLAVKIGSSLPAVITGGVVEEETWGGSEDIPGTTDTETNNIPAVDDTTASQMEKKIILADMLGGDIPVLEPGQEFKPIANLRPGDKIPDFLDMLAAGFVFGLSLPPAFIIEAKLTGPNTRAINGKAQRKFNMRQAMIGKMLEFAWVRVIAHGIMNDGLPAVPGWYKLEWQGPPKVSIDEGREAAQEREDVFNGLMTRQTHYGNRQLNWKRETEQGLAEDRYILDQCIKISKEFGIPVDVLMSRYGFGTQKQPIQTTKPEPQPPQNTP